MSKIKSSLLWIIIVILVLVVLYLSFWPKPTEIINQNQSMTNSESKENIKKNFLPKTNYACEDIVPPVILIGDEGMFLTTINTNFTNGLNIDGHGDAPGIIQNCKRNQEVGSNIHKFDCNAGFVIRDNLDEDGTITRNSYIVSYKLFFDDRNCTDLTAGRQVIGHPNAKILSCNLGSYSCSWMYAEPSSKLTYPIQIDIKDLNKSI